MRVTCEEAGRRYYGEVGTVAGHNAELQRVKVSGLEVLRHVELAASHCSSTESEVKVPCKLLKSVSDQTKRGWLLALGWHDQKLGELVALGPRLEGKRDLELYDEELVLAWKYLAWSLDAPSTVWLVSPLQSHIWLQAAEEKFKLEAGALTEAQAVAVAGVDDSLQQGRLHALQRLWEEAKLVLVPLTAGEHGGGHWTLLAITKPLGPAASGAVQVRYYDTLKNVSQRCLMRAQLWLRGIEPDCEQLKREADTLQKCNASLQVGSECGFTVFWYLEEELRAFLGEGRGRRGWLNSVAARNKVCSVMRTLAAYAGKLQVEEQALAEQLRRDLERRAEEARQAADYEQQMKVLEALQVLACDLLGEGLPDGWLVPVRRAKRRAAASVAATGDGAAKAEAWASL